MLIYEDEISSASTETHVATEDGSKGYRGFVTGVLEELLEKYKGKGGIDRVFSIGPLPMMRAVAQVTRPHGVKTMASLNTIMVDATGMCGSCRVFIDGEMKLTCTDGPTFDAHKVDFSEVMRRNTMFKEEEETACKRYEDGGDKDGGEDEQGQGACGGDTCRGKD
jgi:ferredoxin--NADP+ reductase